MLFCLTEMFVIVLCFHTSVSTLTRFEAHLNFNIHHVRARNLFSERDISFLFVLLFYDQSMILSRMISLSMCHSSCV